MAKLDLTGLSFAELQALASEAQAMAQEKRTEELKVLVNGWKLKADQLGFTVSEVLGELSAYKPGSTASRTRAAPGTASKAEKPYVREVFYKNPHGSETWKGGSTGRQPPWLRELVPDTMSHEEKVKKFKSLAVK